MELALDVSFYLLALVFGLGALMVLVLLKDMLFRGRSSVVLPPVNRVPTTALDEARILLTRLKAAYTVANGEVRQTIGYEIKHLDHRISTLEDKSYTDQADYLFSIKERENLWRDRRALQEELRLLGRRAPAGQRNRLQTMRQQILLLNRKVDEEYQKAALRDRLTLEELQKSGALRPEVLFPTDQKEPPPPEEAEKEDADAAPESPDGEPPPKPVSRWAHPLPPYPPAAGGELRQEDIPVAGVPKSERTYVDPTMSLEGLPGGIMDGADFSLSSLAEVVMTGVHRYRNCAFIGTDLRRIELPRSQGVHVFQDCNLKGASLGQCMLNDTIFRRCNLSNTHWRGARLDRIKFEQCNLEGVHWEGVDLNRTAMTEDMLTAGDFSEASRPPRNLQPEGAPPPAGPATDSQASAEPLVPSQPDAALEAMLGGGETPPPVEAAPPTETPPEGEGAPRPEDEPTTAARAAQKTDAGPPAQSAAPEAPGEAVNTDPPPPPPGPGTARMPEGETRPGKD